jgi:uncharacterized Ntn-hydrolase superfamily protein
MRPRKPVAKENCGRVEAVGEPSSIAKPYRLFDAPLAHTYSIVARDPATGELGAAVQSHWFAVGAMVICAEAEVGAVATQAFVDPSYGPLGLKLMRAGSSATEALGDLLAADEMREIRQVAMVDAQGRAAAHTGKRTLAEAGHIVGAQFTVEANMMLRATVPAAMARAFEGTTGDLAHRMLAALDAAEAEGGDVRGRQSAAFIMVAGKSSGRPWFDKLFDVRVDDHAEPLVELRRLVDVQRAYSARDRAEAAFATGDLESGRREYELAQSLAPHNPEFSFWYGIAMIRHGRFDHAIQMLRPVFARDRNWATLALRMIGSQFLPGDPGAARDAIARARQDL